MNILYKIFMQPKESQRKPLRTKRRRVFFYRTFLYSETMGKVEEMKAILKKKMNRTGYDYEEEQAEIFRKIMGVAYQVITHDMKKSGNTYNYVKFITKRKNGKKKKVIKEYCLSR
ncbi:MAG: hypothetical protein PHH35_01675 [Candidatus Pacebacteria bacterium]|nr:hypothetical protein [Candidatus Paceibacterota bacterium]